MSRRIVAFDIGIKNLAWCCGDISGTKITVLGWQNENLLTRTSVEDEVTKGTCSLCKKKASYEKDARVYCVNHCPSLTPALRDMSGNLLRKLPAVAVLKELAKSQGATKEEIKTKDTSVTFLKKKYCFPIVSAAKVNSFDLEEVHNGIRSVVQKNAELFAPCSHIYLENQPAYKNPVMKSVQMMLFATLRDLLQGPPRVLLVHASRKTAGATKGDEGYKERKNASEVRVQDAFTSNKVGSSDTNNLGLNWFLNQKKRSDLADCLCMVMDAALK